MIMKSDVERLRPRWIGRVMSQRRSKKWYWWWTRDHSIRKKLFHITSQFLVSLSLWRCFITGAHAVRLTPIIYLGESRDINPKCSTQINTHEQIILDNRCHDEIAEDWSLYLDFLAAPDVFLTPGHQRRWLITVVSSWSVFAARGGMGEPISGRGWLN